VLAQHDGVAVSSLTLSATRGQPVPEYSPNDFARWLRQRRAMRRARLFGESVSPGHPDFYDEYGNHMDYDSRRYYGCLIVVVIILVLFFGFLYWACDPFGGGDGDLITTPTLEATTSTTRAGATTTTGAVTTTTTRPGLEVPGPIGELLAPFQLLQIRRAILEDVLDDIIDSVSDNDPGYGGREIDIARLIVYAVAAELDAVNSLFNRSVFECGAADPLVVCPTETLDMPEGEMLVIVVEHDAPIPIDSTERSYVYALVLDSDRDPANDWVFNPPFDWDLFRGTDRWYQAVYDHQSGNWFLTVTQLDANGVPQGPFPSAARLVVEGERAVWFIPSSEIPAFPGLLRATAFAHDGNFTQATRGGDVSGTDPTEPLFDLDEG